MDTPIRQLLANEEAKAILAKHFPDVMDSLQLGMAMDFSLRRIAQFASDVFTDEILQSVEDELAQLAAVA